MKSYLSAILALVCTMLIVSFVVVKRGDNAQHETDTGTIVDFSNRLDSAQTQIAICNGTITALTNSLNESLSTSAALSNHLTEVESTIALDAEKITKLNHQIAELETENHTLGQNSEQRLMELTNQIAGLTSQIASTRASLDQANKDFDLLENRLRRDVAERIVVERKFNNPLELRAQMEKLKKNPAQMVSADSIYAGLDLEIKSNGTLHILSRD